MRLTAAKGGLVREYTAALREEPAMRAYLLGSIVDDVGVAASTWGMQLLTTNLFTDQRERARLMVPSLLCFFLGCIVAGPLADWARHGPPLALARWRWRLVVWGRLIETAALSLAILGVAGGHLTIARVMPYFLVSAFMKTALRPTRIAFEVDLLRREETQVDARGAPLLDERGEPLPYKVHLLSLGAMTSLLRSAARFGGLLLGGRILAAVHGSYVPLFAFDVLTNLGFIAFVVYGCHPTLAPREVRLRELVRRVEADGAGGVRESAAATGRSLVAAGLREFASSLREAARFLRQPAQRPLCWLLLGAWAVEVASEFYDGRMIVRHVLHGSSEAVRHAEIAWTVVSVVLLALLPALTRRVGSLGKIFLVTMLLDGVAIAVAGRVSAAGAAVAIAPFVATLAIDQGLTLTSGALVGVAQNSASSAAMRGRIAASYALVVIVSDMFAEGASTMLSEAVGIPGMLVRVGLAQVALMAAVAALGGRRLWSFGLRSAERA